MDIFLLSFLVLYFLTNVFLTGCSWDDIRQMNRSSGLFRAFCVFFVFLIIISPILLSDEINEYKRFKKCNGNGYGCSTSNVFYVFDKKISELNKLLKIESYHLDQNICYKNSIFVG